MASRSAAMAARRPISSSEGMSSQAWPLVLPVTGTDGGIAMAAAACTDALLSCGRDHGEVESEGTIGLWVESSRIIWVSLPTITYRLTMFSSSRILPGHAYSIMRPMAYSLNFGGCFP